MRQIKIIVEKHPEGYVAYPLGLKGIVVGEGDTYEEALTDVKSAIKFHIETFYQGKMAPGCKGGFSLSLGQAQGVMAGMDQDQWEEQSFHLFSHRVQKGEEQGEDPMGFGRRMQHDHFFIPWGRSAGFKGA